MAWATGPTKARPVLRPQPYRFQGQPRERGVLGEERRWNDPVDESGAGEQRRIGQIGPAQVVVVIGLIHPPVQPGKAALGFGGQPLRRRHRQAEPAQLLEAESDRLLMSTPVDQAAYLNESRVGPLEWIFAEPLDGRVALVGFVQTAQTVECGVATGKQSLPCGDVRGIGE